MLTDYTVEEFGKMAPETISLLTDFTRFPVTPDSKARVLAKLDISTLIELLGNDSNAELACRALIRLIPESTTFLRNHGADLWPLGVQHSNANVRRTTVELLTDLYGQDGGRDYMLQQGLLRGILQRVCDKDLKVANAASVLILKFAADESFCSTFFENVRSELETLLKNDDDTTSQLRVLELMSKIWPVSTTCTELCRKSGAKAQLFRLLESDDGLLQLNAVEVLAALPAGEVTETEMLRLVEAAESLPPGAVASQLSKSIAHFLAYAPMDVQGTVLVARLLSMLHELLQSAAGTPDALEALTILCSTDTGFVRLVQDGRFQQFFSLVPRQVQGTQSDIRLAAIAFAAAALSASASSGRADSAVSQQEGIASSASVIESILRPLTPFMLRLAKTPHQDERLAALQYFRALALHEWGLRSMFAETEFLPHLVNRKVETGKRALELKHETVSAAMQNPLITDIIGPERCEYLRAFLRDGPYYTGPAAAAGLNAAVPVVATKSM